MLPEKYNLEIPPQAWNLNALPNHLRPRFEITGRDERVLAAGRDLDQLQDQLKKEEAESRHAAEQSAMAGNISGMAAVVKAIDGVTPKDMALDIGVPFHKGAAKFYKEVGAL